MTYRRKVAVIGSRQVEMLTSLEDVHTSEAEAAFKTAPPFTLLRGAIDVPKLGHPTGSITSFRFHAWLNQYKEAVRGVAPTQRAYKSVSVAATVLDRGMTRVETFSQLESAGIVTDVVRAERGRVEPRAGDDIVSFSVEEPFDFYRYFLQGIPKSGPKIAIAALCLAEAQRQSLLDEEG